MPSSATQFITHTYQQPYRRAEIQQTVRALDDRTDSYRAFIWALAKKFTNSPEEAAAAVKEMQSDIERCAEKGMIVRTNEERLVARIAWRRLLKFLQ